MAGRQITLSQVAALALFSIFMSHAIADEKIIQQADISFEKCLKVITTSEQKLSIAPVVKDISEQKRLALFTLSEGTITITCDGVNGSIKVSTNIN